MKVFIDGFAAASDRTTGWERYARGVINEFERDPRGLEVEVLEPPTGAGRFWWEQHELPRIIGRAGEGLIHFPAAPPSPRIRRETLTTVCDATLLFHPEWASRAGYWYYRHVNRALLQKPKSWILTISDSSKNDLLLAGADPARLFVAKIADSSACDFVKDNPLPKEIAARVSGRPYALFVGTLEPRKNMPVLRRAWQQLALDDVALVVVGRQGWGPSAGLPENVIETGRVSDSVLGSLYANAHFLVMPSLYEGFGLPLLEALAAGLVAVASDIPAHREVAGDSALFFPPWNEDALAIAIQRALQMGPRERADLVAKGKARADLFHWKAFGDKTATVYEHILEKL